ncbi:PAS domain-containing protein, partial [Balneolaceae bacterium ANBcel3]|nr:PAS domain-containing protein [Balneolaceae bacterium ANBcel3]
MSKSLRSFFFKSGPVGITLVYVLVGGLWILFSDRLLEYYVTDPELYARFQTVKGWFYVVMTGLLLFFLIRMYSHYLNTLRKEFRKTFEQYKTLLGHALQVIVQVDDHGRFIYRNELVNEILGVEPDDLEHIKDLEKLLHPDNAGVLEEIQNHWIDDPQQAIRREIRIHYKKKEWRWYLIIGQDKRQFEHLNSFLLTIRDIHHEKALFRRLVDSNRRFEHLFREAPVGYYTCDAEMVVTDINSTALSIIGMEYYELVGKKKMCDVIDRDDTGCLDKMKEDLSEKGRIENCFITIKNRRNKQEKNVMLDAKAFFDDQGQLLYSIGNLVDIT